MAADDRPFDDVAAVSWRPRAAGGEGVEWDGWGPG